jgi:hypothetical protein
MKTEIYYFNGSGNSLAVSKDLKKYSDRLILLLLFRQFDNKQYIPLPWE